MAGGDLDHHHHRGQCDDEPGAAFVARVILAKKDVLMRPRNRPRSGGVAVRMIMRMIARVIGMVVVRGHRGDLFDAESASIWRARPRIARAKSQGPHELSSQMNGL
jgi:hypothetical protein